VKLQNIHVSKLPGDEVELTLSDFGLSAIKEKGKGGKPEWKLEPGLRPEKGTPLYLNTSRLLGEVSEADDIPAFGMALGELLMGKRIDQLSPGQTYLVRYHGDIPQIRLPISKITPDAPPDLAFIADYSIHLAKTMREVRELMGDATSLRLKLSDKLGNAAPAKEKVRVEFEKMAFKKYLVADLKNADESKRKAAIRFVFRSENLIDELIASKDLSRKEKSELITLIKADVEKGTLDDTKLKGLMMGSVNPYYSKEGYQKALKSLTGWRSYLPF
jgi:serine/threonine protein kinase